MREKTITGWKIFTHDWRSPIQRGPAVFDGTFPFTTPTTEVDESPAKCGAGWNFTKDMATAFKIAGMWPTGRPARVVAVTAETWIERGPKLRSRQITCQRLADPEEISAGIMEFSKVFGEHQAAMATEQLAWYSALGRPLSNPDAVARGLQAALDARKLSWQVKRCRDAEVARVAWSAWAAWAARSAWAAWASWDVRDAWNAWDVRAARDALDALVVQYVARRHWNDQASDLYTIGIRDAYMNGLEIAFPTGPHEMGYVLA